MWTGTLQKRAAQVVPSVLGYTSHYDYLPTSSWPSVLTCPLYYPEETHTPARALCLYPFHRLSTPYCSHTGSITVCDESSAGTGPAGLPSRGPPRSLCLKENPVCLSSLFISFMALFTSNFLMSLAYQLPLSLGHYSEDNLSSSLPSHQKRTLSTQL